MPANIDFEAIKAALTRRSSGGSSMPALDQTSSPGGVTPMGGPNTPTTPVSQPPMGQGGVLPSPRPNTPPPTSKPVSSPVSAVSEVANGNSGGFDDETRKIAKVLVQKLLSVL